MVEHPKSQSTQPTYEKQMDHPVFFTQAHAPSTEIHLMVRSRLGEICSYSYLPALPGPAWVLLNCILRILCTSVLFLSLNSHPFEVTGSYFLDIVDFYLRPWTSWETLTMSAGCNGFSVRAALGCVFPKLPSLHQNEMLPTLPRRLQPSRLNCN